MIKTTRSRNSKQRRQKRLMLFEAGEKCFVCGQGFNKFEDATLEHIVPLAKGGKWANSNLSLSHKKCNLRKGDDENFVSAQAIQALVKKAVA
jgi:5-methylcytosine-specific restriction endonuclease McrA